MPKHKATNRTTGETVYFDWDGDKPPTQKDVRRISDQQRESRIALKSKALADEQGRSFTEKLMTSPASEYAMRAMNALGLNQPWHPLDSAGEVVEGAKQAFTGEGPGAHPRIGGLNKVASGLMGVIGPPATAAGYAMAPLVTGGAMLAGNLANEGTRRGIEALAPDTSPEVKEALSTVAGLGVGGIVGGRLSRGKNSTTTGPIKPAKVEVPEKASLSGTPQRRLAAPPRQIEAGPPPPPPAQIEAPPPPTKLLPRSELFDMPPASIPMPAAGTYATQEAFGAPRPPQLGPAPEPLLLPPGGGPLSRVGPGGPQYDFIKDIEGRPPLPPVTTPDVVSAARPEPLSPAEIPSVSGPPPLARQPLGPVPDQGPVVAAPPPAGSISPVWDRSLGEQTPAPPPAPAPPVPQPPPPPVEAPTVVRPPIAPLPAPEVPAPVAVSGAAPPPAITPEVLPPVKPPVISPGAALAQAALKRAQKGTTVDVTPKKPLPPPVITPSPVAPPAAVAPPPVATQELAPVPPPGAPTAQAPTISLEQGKMGVNLEMVRDYFRKNPKSTATQLMNHVRPFMREDEMRVALKAMGDANEITRTGKTTLAATDKLPGATPQETPQATTLPEVKPPVEVKNVQEPPPPVEPPQSVQTPDQKRAKLNNDVLDFAKRRKDVTVPQIQTQFGIPGDVAREMLGSLVKRGLLESDRKGKFNYKALEREERVIEKQEGAPPPKPVETPPSPEITGPRAAKIRDLKELIERAHSDKDTEYAKVLEERLAAQEKQGKLEAGTKTQKGLATEIDNLETQIDKLEDTNESAPELSGLYRKLAELEKKRDRALVPEAEKYGPRVANLRSLHAEATLSGIDHATLSKRAKSEYKVESMSEMTPEQLSELSETIKTERMEKEAEIQELEEKDMDGTATPEEKNRLKEFWKDETGTASIGEGLRFVASKLSSRGPKRGHLRKEWTQSGETTLNKEKAGGLARDIRKARTEGEIAAGNLVADYHKNTADLTDVEFKNMIGVIQGTERAKSAKVLNAARVEDARIKKLQTKLGNQTTNVDPITSTRTDRALLSDFYTAASNKVAEFENFGRRKSVTGQKGIPEDVLDAIETSKARGGDWRANFRMAMSYFNPENLDPAKQVTWDKFSGYEVASKLGLSVIGNLTQPANVALVTGNLTALKSAMRMATKYKGAKEFALRSGSTLSSVTHETRLSEGVTPKSFSARMLDATQFSNVEVHNRILASMAGAEHAVNMFKKLKENPKSTYARRHLSHWLGLDPDMLVNQQKLTLEQLQTAAHTLSDRTQFRTSPLELPVEWKTSLSHRMLTLFKSFAFNHAKFMKEATLGEMKRGNFRPLIPLLTTFPILGTLADQTKRLLVGREQHDNFWDGVLGTYSAVGGAGIASDIATRAIAGKLSDWVVGPVVGDAFEVVDSVIKDIKLSQSSKESTRDKTGKNVGRFVTKQIPVVGRPLAAHFFPYEKKR